MGKREEGRRAGGARLGTAPAPVTAFERATQGAGGDSKANGRHRLPAPVAGVRVAGCSAFHGLGHCPLWVREWPHTRAPPAARGRPQTMPCPAIMWAEGVRTWSRGPGRDPPIQQEWARIVEGPVVSK